MRSIRIPAECAPRSACPRGGKSARNGRSRTCGTSPPDAATRVGYRRWREILHSRRLRDTGCERRGDRPAGARLEDRGQDVVVPIVVGPFRARPVFAATEAARLFGARRPWRCPTGSRRGPTICTGAAEALADQASSSIKPARGRTLKRPANATAVEPRRGPAECAYFGFTGAARPGRRQVVGARRRGSQEAECSDTDRRAPGARFTDHRALLRSVCRPAPYRASVTFDASGGVTQTWSSRRPRFEARQSRAR